MASRFISNKIASFCDIVESKKLDVVAVAEKWLYTKETSASLADVTPNGFKLVQNPRKGRGGGVAIMVNELFNLTPCDIPTYTSFEAVACKIETSSFSARVICLYRLQDYSSEFFKQFEDLLINMSSVPGELFILGDFNLHLDTPSSQFPNPYSWVLA